MVWGEAFFLGGRVAGKGAVLGEVDGHRLWPVGRTPLAPGEIHPAEPTLINHPGG